MVDTAKPPFIDLSGKTEDRPRVRRIRFKLVHWLLLVIAVALLLDISMRGIAFVNRDGAGAPPVPGALKVNGQWIDIQKENAKINSMIRESSKLQDESKAKLRDLFREMKPMENPSKGQIHLL